MAMIRSQPILDKAALIYVADILTIIMNRHVDEIIDGDTLPQYAHVINGWGNARWKGRTVVDRLERFAHGMGSQQAILQRNPEGDYHPWQTFAYAVMAGVPADLEIGSIGITLRQLAANSRHLNTSDGCELGHLLFALAYLEPSANAPAFEMKDRTASVPELMEIAVDAHHFGHFDVCRKFHLTEGICAAAGRIDGLHRWRPEAQAFLDGQMDMLLLLCAIMTEARLEMDDRSSPERHQLLERLRETLVMGSHLENHCYYAGHLIELAGFAMRLGFVISVAHRNAIVVVLNEMNRLLADHVGLVSFYDAFLHLGHFRRASTLALSHSTRSPKRSTTDAADLAAFTAIFEDASDVTMALPCKELPPMTYVVAPDSKSPRQSFELIVTEYAAIAPASLAATGGFAHFRRIIIPGWPRALHYEFFDYGDEVGAELHLESASIGFLQGLLPELAGELNQCEPRWHVDWDHQWCGVGRLRVLCEDLHPRNVAFVMQQLIARTRDSVSAHLASSFCTRP